MKVKRDGSLMYKFTLRAVFKHCSVNFTKENCLIKFKTLVLKAVGASAICLSKFCTEIEDNLVHLDCKFQVKYKVRS